MGTVFEIKVLKKGLSQEKAIAAIDSAFAEVECLEKQMSEWIPDSTISLITRYAGVRPVAVTDEIIAVVEKALIISEQTGGEFDISFKPLGNLWDVMNRKKPPEDSQIKKILGLVDYKNILLDKVNKTIFLKKPGMAIGLGGIAKGYALGRAVEKITEAGIRNFIIDAGGDLYFSGNRNGKAWSCGIKDPDNTANILLRFWIKSDCAVVTSGNYERFFIFEDKKYHHIIDPRMGYPGTGVKSVTVFAKDPALADAYATSFFLLGYDRSLKIISKNKDLAFIMIGGDGSILKSGNISSFAGFITLDFSLTVTGVSPFANRCTH
ncbi:MAG: FAD:protein FMN transferase [Thermodesulfobacteriota bacterium]|nr:FAD:protein FMN transferase [Thermodesulfobacteriota bacterium]